MENKGTVSPIKALWFVLVLVLANEYLFLTQTLAWPAHGIVGWAPFIKLFKISYIYIRVLLIFVIIGEFIFNWKVVKEKFVLVFSLFVPPAALLLTVHYFADKIVSYLYPPLFVFLFVLYFFFKKPNDAEISQEDFDEDVFEPLPKVSVTKYNIILEVHSGKTIGYVEFPNPFRAFLVVGGAGSGKSFASIEPIMWQMVMKDFVLFNYDYKFPDLTNALQKFLDFREKAGLINYPHFVINFFDPGRTHQFNFINPKYIEDTIELSSIATTFIQNIKKEWVRNKDFWADAAIAYLNALMLYQYRNHPDKCSIPHIVELGCKPYGTILEMLLSDEECEKVIVSYAQAVKDKAGAQLAGMSGSLQVFLPNLSKPEIYWPLSGDDFTLDFNNPQNPHHISLGNDPGLRQDFLQPIIGCIGKVALSKANRNYENIQKQRGEKTILPQIPAGIFFDELVTTFIEGIDQVPNVGRGNLISIVVGIQMKDQLVDRYGQEKAKVLMGSFANMIIGLVNDSDTAKIFSELFGEKKVKVKNESVNISHDGKTSKNISYSIQKEKRVPVDELTTLPTGQFYFRYTNEYQKGWNLLKKRKKPFAAGTILLENVKSIDEIPDLNDPFVPIKKKLSYPYMIPPFAKFSDSDDVIQRGKDMKEILMQNYKRIKKEVNDQLSDFIRNKELEEIEREHGKKELLAELPDEAFIDNEQLKDTDYEDDREKGEVSYYAG